MPRLICLLTALFLAATVCQAQSLDGRVLKIEGAVTANTPISVPCDAPAPDTTIQVVAKKGGTVCSATIADGELVFMPEAADSKYEVKVLKDAKSAAVQIAKVDGDDELTVKVNGEDFTSYHYSNENKKPFLWPVLAEGGATITRNWPMGEDKYVSEDHVHHKSLWVSYGDLNGVDCWGEGGNSGFQHSGEVTFGSGDAFGWIRAKNVWQDKDHKPVIDEAREYRFYATPASARTLDLSVTFTAAYGPVKFGDTKEGGILAYRMRPEIVAKYINKETKLRMNKGVMTNIDGPNSRTNNVWGKPSPWTDYSGDIEGVGVRGLAAFDHADNLRHPTTWHFRDYGLNGANCFGLSDFTKGKENGDYELAEGESLTFKYRVIIHSGDVEEAQVAERYAAYANPPKVTWVK